MITPYSYLSYKFKNSFFIPSQPSKIKLRKHISVDCKCKDERTWCLTCLRACVIDEVSCGIACHGAKNNGGFEIERRKHKMDDGYENSKRQCKDTGGKMGKSLK